MIMLKYPKMGLESKKLADDKLKKFWWVVSDSNARPTD